MEPNINNQMEEDQNEEDLWYDDENEDWDDDEERRKDAELEERQERALMCTCGAWVMTERGNVYHVADCYCGAE